jgi:hypothetical protein
MKIIDEIGGSPAVKQTVYSHVKIDNGVELQGCLNAMSAQIERLRRSSKLLRKVAGIYNYKDTSRIRFSSACYASDLVLDIYKAAINQLEDELDHLYEHEEDLLKTFYESTLAEMNKGEIYDGE